ncbi:MAG: ArsR family transcriptional regulator [Sphaerisporangium sp.]|jgi:ArsR family transcriptional regulator, arsenate/arsenite/antimonite-responsive transcriptional repressor / arsenate reductase (thioredoxin)|nr:ArsR family transcriptional regulator [Sphaerisporangium sp.]
MLTARPDRSEQLAAALWARNSTVPAASAATQPATMVHPTAVARRHGLNLEQAQPIHLDEVVRPDDVLVAVCDNAHEQLRRGDHLHCSVPDRVRAGTEDALVSAFHDLADRIARLAPAVHPPQE